VQSRGFGPPRDGGNAEASCNIGIVLLALLVLPGLALRAQPAGRGVRARIDILNVLVVNPTR
jgi:hypothetical protein